MPMNRIDWPTAAVIVALLLGSFGVIGLRLWVGLR